VDDLSAVRDWEADHFTLPGPPPAEPLIGLGRRADVLVGVTRAGVDHPPPRCGDGDLESDMRPGTGKPGERVDSSTPLARESRANWAFVSME